MMSVGIRELIVRSHGPSVGLRSSRHWDWAAPARDQHGFSLVDVLAAIVFLTLTVGGVMAATFTASRIAVTGNTEGRMNNAVTAYAEALKAIPYINCATVASYEDAFNEVEDELGASDSQLLNSPYISFQILDVQPGAAQCHVDGDTGIQTITVRVQLKGRVLEREVVKRNLDLNEEPFTVQIIAPRLISGANASAVQWQPMADPGTFDVFSYEWWCGDPEGELPGASEPAFPTVGPDFPGPLDPPITSPNDATVECDYDAPPDGTDKYGRMFLRAFENGTGRSVDVTASFLLPSTLVPRVPPAVQWSVAGYEEVPSGSPLPSNQDRDCKIVTTPCAHDREVTFVDVSPPPTGPGIAQWVWNFGDNSPEVRCSFSASDLNGDLCRTVNHTYVGGGEFEATLTVYDRLGTRGSDKTKVYVEGPIVNLPTMSLNEASLLAQLTSGGGYSPMKITVDGSDTHADGCVERQMCNGYLGGIKTWTWDFGMGPGTPGAVQTGANLSEATFQYPQSSTEQVYNITLTVETWDGLINSITVPEAVTLQPIPAPIGITNRGGGLSRKGDLPFIRNAYFDFQYKNIPQLPGETYQYELRMTASQGFCGTFGAGQSTRTVIIPAGSPGAIQQYRWQFTSSPFRGFNGICATDNFNFSARTIRHTSYGTFYGDWSPNELLNPDFF